MAEGHPQAYIDIDVVLASSFELVDAALLAARPAADGLRASRIQGFGLVAARRTGDFTHVVAGLDGRSAIDLAGWHEELGELGDLETREVDLGFLAATPRRVATRLLDAALAGPLTFHEPDAARRQQGAAWLCSALPGGAGLTFSTAGDEDVHIRAADVADAIDATAPSDAAPSFYARVALELAARGTLREAVSRVEEPDGLALAVHGGATDLIAPHQLPLALQLITELAAAGHVREAARAAAAIPARAGAELVVREEVLLPEVVEPEPEEIQEADVVEREALPDDVVVSVPFDVEPAPPEPDERIVIRFDDPPPAEPEPEYVLPDDAVVSVPFDLEPAPAEADDPFEDPPPPEVVEPEEVEERIVIRFDDPPPAVVVEPEPEEAAAAPDPFEDEDVAVAVPFEPAAAAPEPDPEPVDEEVEAVEEPLPDADAWSNLLAELKTESVAPDESLPVMPDIEELRVRDRLLPPTPEPKALPEPEPQPEPEP